MLRTRAGPRMSIGGSLAKARRDAGLSVAEVSQRTRIRETIIRGIEHDDYAACGGDFYARGHLRSIARAVGADPDPLVREYDETLRAPEEITAAEALQPLLPIRADGGRAPDDVRRGPRLNWAAVLALALIVVLGFLGYRLAFVGGPAPAHRQAGHAAHPRPSSARPATPRATSSAPLTVALAPVSAAAFGPGGTTEGDNPQNAALALAGHPASPWHTSWYATADFGNLKAGTGLLLDMGRPVTVTSAQITLGSIPGADLELRVGNVLALAGLRPVASAANAGGVVELRPAAPARGRYLLIWFTRLPPDNSGTYQADISGVVLRGQGG